ncbi:MAG TPA: response regulator [Candidatus Acidoferrales bacterium]|nr:response regulator [Candidatus Acidoferrales bacterium]
MVVVESARLGGRCQSGRHAWEAEARQHGREAVEVATSFRPDIAFLDIGMPGLDGYAVACWIREEPWGGAV